MFVYEKKLQYPVKIKTPNAAMAKFIIAQYGGPSGEAGAALRYLSQRFSMPYSELKAVYTDIGTEEQEPRCYQLHYQYQLKKGRPKGRPAGFNYSSEEGIRGYIVNSKLSVDT